MANAKQTSPATKRTYYLVRYTVHDGECEYDLHYVSLSERMEDIVAELTGLDGDKLQAAVRNLDIGDGAEIGHDYRIIDDVTVQEIAEVDLDILRKYGFR